MRILLALALLGGCDDGVRDPNSDAGSTIDGGAAAIDGSTTTDGGASTRIRSTLTSSCATLQGRAIVNYNTNLGISFTEDDSPYTFIGSIQFELPDGFTGAVPNPEGYDGSSPRKVVAVTSPSFTLHGNHCWLNGSMPSGGSVTIAQYAPNDGIVKATFTALPLRSCTGAAICTISGTIETTGEGVFE